MPLPGMTRDPSVKPEWGCEIDPMDGLIACWMLNDETGSKIQDLSAYGRNGTVKAYAASVWGANERGVVFAPDGATQGIDITAPLIPTGTSPYTVEALVTPLSTSAGAHGIFVCGTSSSYNMQLRRDGANWSHYYQDGGGNQLVQMVSGVVANQTFHLFACRDATSTYIYVNGILKDTKIVGTGVTPGTVNSIGYNATSGSGVEFGDYKIHFVRIYNRMLSNGEIRQRVEAPYGDIQASSMRRFYQPSVAATIFARRTDSLRTGSRTSMSGQRGL